MTEQKLSRSGRMTGGATNITMMSIVLLYVGGLIGLVVMIVGLIMAAVAALTKRTRERQ